MIPQRKMTINLWYETEWQRLSRQADIASGEKATEMITAMNYLDQQKSYCLGVIINSSNDFFHLLIIKKA